jgi:hypothetical protein
MSHLNRLLLAILLGAMQPGFAMQLGASKGSAVFGRPLDLTIPVRFDAPVEDPFNCFGADIFQADSKFDAGRVRIDVTPAANGLDATVRIRSNSAVVEPWAKVILRSHCGAKVTRQYDFLTDFAADMPALNPQAESAVASNHLPATNLASQAAATSATVSNALPVLPAAPVSNWSVKRAQIAAQTATQTTSQASLPATPKVRRAPKPAAVDPKPTVLATAPANPLGQVAHLGQSRLKMETFELTDEHQVLLKLSTAMIAPTGMRTPEEIQALAQATAVWRAINGMPALAAATVTAPAPVETAVAAVVQAKPSAIAKDGKHEFSNPIVYGLIGLLALTLACIAWLWFHVRRGTQPGYGWLEETALNDVPVHTEPTQFLPTAFTDTAFVPEEQVEELAEQAELANTEFETPRPQLAEAAFDASPLAVLLSNKEAAALSRKKTLNKISTKAKASKEFSAANSPERSPAHFDDSRFDERYLNAQKIARQPVHDRPIISPTELMDLVLDTPPKLRSVPSPVPVTEVAKDTLPDPLVHAQKPRKSAPKAIPKPETETTTKAEAPSESKSNMIDFEIFAEPVPLPKPSRFVG